MQYFYCYFIFQAIRMRHGEIFEEFHLYQPGAYHHARFMGKGLYVMKIYILSQVYVALTRRQQRALDRLVRYVITLYGRYFLTTPLASAAPRHDLQLWYDLQMYANVDDQLAGKALNSMKNHLWYLVPELVVLAMFDSKVSYEEKQLMAVTLLNTHRPAAFATGKPGQPCFHPVIDKLEDDRPPLSVFISERSWLIFDKALPYLRLTRPPGDNPHLAAAPVIAGEFAWLQENPILWTDYDEYVRLNNWVNRL